MTETSEEIERLRDMLTELESSVEGAQTMTSVFAREMDDVTASMRAASQDASGLSRSLGANLRSAFDDLIFDGARLSDVLSRVGQSLSTSVLNAALKPVQAGVTGLVSGGISALFGGAFANGGAFSQGQVVPFANGGVVGGPTAFPMRGGRMGLMGEAGPEAIMPLTRGADGRLGVQAQGGGRPVSVTMNIATPDAASFARSRTQVAAQLGRALGRGRRNL